MLGFPYVILHFLMLHYFDVVLHDVALLNVECSTLHFVLVAGGLVAVEIVVV